MENSFRVVPLGFILGCVFVLLVPNLSWATLSCGDVIGPGEVETLTHNLSCPGGDFNTAALTVDDGSILNLGDYTIDCVDQQQIGIRMVGGGSIVQKGTVTNCFLGLVVAGKGSHIVRKVVASSNQNGFVTRSEDNELYYNRATNNTTIGFLLESGNRNTFEKNLANDNRDGFFMNSSTDHTLANNQAISNRQRGFFIQGNRNQVTGNLAKDNRIGFEIRFNDNQVLFNTSIGNRGDGFQFRSATGNTALVNTAKQNGNNGIRVRLGAINNTLLGNVAKGNTGDDLRDDNDHCDNNTWQGNRFKTSNQDCIQ